MTYDQWKTESGYAEKTPEQENEGRDCPICNGDCAGANPPVYFCPMKDKEWQCQACDVPFLFAGTPKFCPYCRGQELAEAPLYTERLGSTR